MFDKSVNTVEVGVLPEGQILLKSEKKGKFLVMGTSMYMADRLLSVLENKRMSENDTLRTLLHLANNKVLKCEIDNRDRQKYTSTLDFKSIKLHNVRPSLGILICLLMRTPIKIRRQFLQSVKIVKKLMGESNFESIKMYNIKDIEYTYSSKVAVGKIDERGYFDVNFNNASVIGEYNPIIAEYTDGENFYNFGLPPSLFVQKTIAKKLLDLGNDSILRGREPTQFRTYLENVDKYTDEFSIILELLNRANTKITDAYFKLVGIALSPNHYVVKPKDAVLKLKKDDDVKYLISDGDYAFILSLQLLQIKILYLRNEKIEGYA
jgi:bifunctional DNase/RNase